MVFWGPNGSNYVCQIDKAGLYTYDEAMSRFKKRSTDIPRRIQIETTRYSGNMFIFHNKKSFYKFILPLLNYSAIGKKDYTKREVYKKLILDVEFKNNLLVRCAYDETNLEFLDQNKVICWSISNNDILSLYKTIPSRRL